MLMFPPHTSCALIIDGYFVSDEVDEDTLLNFNGKHKITTEST